MTYLYIVAGAIGSLVGCAITAYTLTENQKTMCARCRDDREEECRDCNTRRRF